MWRASRAGQLARRTGKAAWSCRRDTSGRGASAGDGDDGRVPFNPEGVLEHLDSAHEVELDIVERAAFALEERNAGLGGAGGVGAA